MEVDPNNNNPIADDEDNNTDTSPDEEGVESFISAIFFLNNLPFLKEDDEDNDPNPVENDPDHPHYMHWLAETYYSPLEEILSSHLNDSAIVENIYVNFGHKGYYVLNPETKFPATLAEFEAMLRGLFEEGTTQMEDPSSDNVTWEKIDDLPSLIYELPDGTLKIGCFHGDATQGSDAMDYESYIERISDRRAFLFVVGRLDSEEIKEFIDDYVDVSEDELAPDECLKRIISALESKWPDFYI